MRDYGLSMGFEPPHPNPLPCGEREHAEIAAPSEEETVRGVHSIATSFQKPIQWSTGCILARGAS